MVAKIRIRLPKPLPAPIACQRCGYDTDSDGYCSFCGHTQKPK